MEIKKLGLTNLKGKLSRVEMKNIMAGSGDVYCGPIGGDCAPGYQCPTGGICRVTSSAGGVLIGCCY